MARRSRAGGIQPCDHYGMMSDLPDPAKTFEAGLEELDAIVKQMESGDLPLERALDLFERGMRLSEECRKQLEEAETRVEMLVRRGDKIVPESFRPEK